MPCGYIDDGYTLDGYIKESPGIYPAVRFKYRPLTVEQRIRLFDGWSRLTALEHVRKTTETLARQICGWDLADQHGRTVDCRDPATHRRLAPALHERLLDVICGSAAADPDPDSALSADDGEGFADASPEGNF